jgi:hypothetical protein
MQIRIGTALAAATIALAAWEPGSTTHAVESHNRLATNRLATNRLATNRLATNKLAAYALTSTRLEANTTSAELLQTPDGREVYSYLISCALPEGMVIEATIAGAPDSAPPETNYVCAAGRCSFYGAIGLAEDWIDHRLASKDERWMSACMFARVNANDTAEAVSLRGTHPRLATSQDEAELYTVVEGAFFGNLFTHEDDPIEWIACRGEGQAQGEFGGLTLRDCAEEDPAHPGTTYCQFVYAGDCRDYSPEFPSPYACKSFDTALGVYGDCHTTSGDGHWPSSKTYREVITVYVSP